MSGPESWTCSVCGRPTTVGRFDRDADAVSLSAETGRQKEEGIRISAALIRCPNTACQASDLVVQAYWGKPLDNWAGSGSPPVQPNYSQPAGIGKFRFLPETAKPLSAHVAPTVIEDYREAYLVRSLSPKASATLARRALQGMIRDFWSVSKSTLAAELLAIKEKCDHDLYEAMMGLKSIGNIGAHPERDISVIVEIEPDEPQQLLDLIHLLDQEWYVARAAKQARLNGIKQLAESKRPSTGGLADVPSGPRN